MKEKQEIVANWLPRYTGTSLEQFGQHILLTNFGHYVDMFADWHGVPVQESRITLQRRHSRESGNPL